MSAHRWARRVLFFFVLALTSLANLLFVPVDNDGDDSTPPVIFSFNFVTPESTNATSASHQNEQSAAALRQTGPSKSPANFPITFSLPTTETASITPHITPLRC